MVNDELKHNRIILGNYVDRSKLVHTHKVFVLLNVYYVI